MKYVNLVENTNTYNLYIESFEKEKGCSLDEDIKKAFNMLISPNDKENKLNLVKKEIEKDVDVEQIKLAHEFFVKMAKLIESGKVDKVLLDRVEKFKEWMKAFYNTHESKLSAEMKDAAKRLVLDLKKEKGFKGNVKGI